jgi:hypothetical protein
VTNDVAASGWDNASVEALHPFFTFASRERPSETLLQLKQGQHPGFTGSSTAKYCGSVSVIGPCKR